MLLKDIYFIIRYYIYILFVKILYKLGLMPNSLDYFLQNEGKYLYYESKKIKLSMANYRYKNLRLNEGKCTDYDIKKWEAFILDIKNNGVINNPIHIKVPPFTKNKDLEYELDDGNHRLKALEILYGKDYTVTIDCYTEINHIKYKRQYKRLINKLILDTHKESLIHIKNKTY